MVEVGRTPGGFRPGYLRFMYIPSSGLRRIGGGKSEILTAEFRQEHGGLRPGDNPNARVIFRRSILLDEVLRETGLRTILSGPQVSLDSNLAAAARAVLTEHRFFNPADFGGSFAPVRKWNFNIQEAVGQQMVFTRSVAIDREAIAADIRTRLGENKLGTFSDVMWGYLGQYFIPLLPDRILGPVCYYSGKCAAAEAIRPVTGIAGEAEAIAYLKKNHGPNATLLGLLDPVRQTIEALLAPPPPTGAAEPTEIMKLAETTEFKLPPEDK
jgi:hypothetical protein